MLKKEKQKRKKETKNYSIKINENFFETLVRQSSDTVATMLIVDAQLTCLAAQCQHVSVRLTPTRS